jgi:hypothetical protein
MTAGRPTRSRSQNPGETVTFGVASETGQPISEEFYAIDDVNFETG